MNFSIELYVLVLHQFITISLLSTSYLNYLENIAVLVLSSLNIVFSVSTVISCLYI